MSSIANFSQHEVLTAEKLNSAFNDLEAAMEALPDGSAVSAQVAVNTVNISNDEKKLGVFPYFTMAQKPTIAYISSSSQFQIKFPTEGTFRVYNATGTQTFSVTLSGQVFNISVYERLVANTNDKTLSVVDFTESTSNEYYINLFAHISLGVCAGLFTEYYYSSYSDLISGAWRRYFAYFSGSGKPTFTELSDYKIRIDFPDADFRMYDDHCSQKYYILHANLIAQCQSLQGTDYITLPTRWGALFYNRDNGNIEVADDFTEDKNLNANRILLLSNPNAGAAQGILAPYYYSQKISECATGDIYENLLTKRDEVASRSDFSFFFFTDIHGATTNLTRLLALSSKWGCTDAVINGGDTVAGLYNDDLTWYNSQISGKEILNVVGNHDAFVSMDWTYTTLANVYANIISPVISNVSGIVQPDNAAANGLCYYYKDYNSKVRVIAHDSTYGGNIKTAEYADYISAQNTWLTSVLADAKTKGLAVIIVTHATFIHADVQRISGCSFNSWKDFSKGTVDDESWDGMAVLDSTLDIVDDFISGGGKFVCWLSGHTHQDNFITNTKHTHQVMFNSGSANYSKHSDGAIISDTDRIDYDLFNLIGVDTDNGVFKVLRIGNNIDDHMIRRETMCYDYVNMQLISNN